MTLTEMIAVLQALHQSHGDIPVRAYDDNEYQQAAFVGLGTFVGWSPEPFVAVGPCPYTPPDFVEELRRTLWECPIDHWSWNPDNVETCHGALLRAAGVEDISTWVTQRLQMHDTPG